MNNAEDLALFAINDEWVDKKAHIIIDEIVDRRIMEEKREKMQWEVLASDANYLYKTKFNCERLTVDEVDEAAKQIAESYKAELEEVYNERKAL